MNQTACATALAAILASACTMTTAIGDEIREHLEVEPGGTLLITLSVGSIEIGTHDADVVEIEASGSARCRLRYEDRDTRVYCGPRGFFGIGTPRTRLRVRVPELYSVRARTGGGWIEIEDLDGEIDARTGGGRIEVDGARGLVKLHSAAGSVRVDNVDGDLEVVTKGGSLRVADVTGRVQANVNGGSIRLDEVGGPVEARAVGGSIDVRFVSDPSGSLRTEGGHIEVEFPEDSVLTLDAATVGGKVRLESEIEISGRRAGFGDRIRGKINGGGGELRLRTRGGSIRISAR